MRLCTVFLLLTKVCPINMHQMYLEQLYFTM